MLYFYCKIMITNFLIFFKKSPLLAFIKFESRFLTGSLAVCLSAPVQGEAGGRGVWGEFRPPSPANSVRIFSNRHRFDKIGPLLRGLNFGNQKCSLTHKKLSIN